MPRTNDNGRHFRKSRNEVKRERGKEDIVREKRQRHNRYERQDTDKEFSGPNTLLFYFERNEVKREMEKERHEGAKFLSFVSGGNIPRVETKKRECWKFLDWRLNSENDSRVHGQPSFPAFASHELCCQRLAGS